MENKEPITQILGVPEGDVGGETFINQGSTINITCIVRNLPEKSSMYWTHNNEVRGFVIFYELTETKSQEKQKNNAKKSHIKAKVCYFVVGFSGCWKVNLLIENLRQHKVKCFAYNKRVRERLTYEGR